MGKNKRYLIKTVNLGETGNPARLLSEIYIKKYGKQEFSALVRKLIVIFLSDKPEFKDWKKIALIHQRKEIQSKIPELSNQLRANEEELEKLGVDIKELISMGYDLKTGGIKSDR